MKSKVGSVLSDLIFYGALIIIVVTVLAADGKNSTGPRVIGGYSAFVVLTGSMEDVIPKGSLVITKSVDAKELQIGDDITYMLSEKTTVTHRIIAIEEEYLTTGERAFTTKGTMNAEADRLPVAAVNVVGKVIFHNKLLGNVISFGQENWPLVIFFIVVAVLFIKITAHILKKEEKQEEEKQETVRPAGAENRKKAGNGKQKQTKKAESKKQKQTKRAEKVKKKQTKKAEKLQKKQERKDRKYRNQTARKTAKKAGRESEMLEIPETQKIPENRQASRIIEDEDGFMIEIIDL